MKKQNAKSVRTAIIGVVFMLWLAAVGVRAGYLQLYLGQWLSDKAVGQVAEKVTVYGKRGTIYDAQHKAMAVSIETPSIAANPAVIENKTENAYALAKALGLKTKEILSKINNERRFVWLKRQASPREAQAVRALKIKGVDFLPEHTRFYPNTTLAGQVLGFSGIDGHGLEGLEFYYDRELTGGEAKVTIFKDALGRGFDMDERVGSQQAGNNLILTLDGHIQYIAEQALAEAVEKFQARSGLAVVMNPRTGAVLAMAHYPMFNPNNFRKYECTVWRNRAITDPFEPGSTMKMFTAAAGLGIGVTTADTIFYCEKGTYVVGGHTIHDTKPHGWLSLQQIVKYSSNIGVIKLVEKMGRKPLFEALRNFGFGDRTGIDCPGESTGSLSHYKNWTSVDTGAISFGQGLAVTGLQLTAAVAAIANDGQMMRPYIVQAVTDPNGEPIRTFEPVPGKQVISTNTARNVRQILRSVITEGGTGEVADLDGYDVCGKTGTAQKINPDGKYARNKYVASFVGFAPADHPALVTLVVVDEPKKSHYGSTVAAPAFKQIMKEALSYLNIAPVDGLQRLRVSREVKVSG